MSEVSTTPVAAPAAPVSDGKPAAIVPAPVTTPAPVATPKPDVGTAAPVVGPDGKAAVGPDGKPSPADPVFAKFIKEYEETGNVSNDSMAELETLGVNRAFIGKLISKQAEQLLDVYNAGGGKDTYDKAIQWAGKEYNAEQINAMNARLHSNDLAVVKAAVTELTGAFRTATGSEGALVNGMGTGGPAVKPFESRYDMTKATQDPRYKKDPRYRQEVERRVIATDFASL